MKKTWKSIIVVILALSLLTAPVIADDNTSLLLTKIENLITIIQTYYYKDVTVNELIDGAIKGMFKALDKHSVYFTPEEFAEFNSDIYGEYAGVGMYIEKKDDYIQVIAPIEGTPAARADIRTGDIILYVDGQETKGIPSDQVAAKLRGDAGTRVKIGIKREGISDIIYIELIREIIKINPIKYEIMKDNIGYIRITQFNGHGYDSFAKAVNEFKAKNVKGVVIDLRNNPGGLLDEVINMCKLIIPKGTIVSVDYKTRESEVYSSDLPKAPFKIVLLVDEGSASASEIMAGAIKDSGTGKLVGQKTYGKGTVQTILSMTDGSGLKVTVAKYLTPSGYILDGKGIIPDFEVQNTIMNTSGDLVPLTGQRSVKNRMIGLDVQAVQQRLKALGYSVGTADGIFGKGTLAAVQKFQKDNKLKLDSSMDAEDIKVLNDKFGLMASSKDAQMDKAILELKKMIK